MIREASARDRAFQAAKLPHLRKRPSTGGISKKGGCNPAKGEPRTHASHAGLLGSDMGFGGLGVWGFGGLGVWGFGGLGVWGFGVPVYYTV